MRVQLIAANWKMNTTLNEAVALVKEMLPGLNRINNVEKLVHDVSFPFRLLV